MNSAALIVLLMTVCFIHAAAQQDGGAGGRKREQPRSPQSQSESVDKKNRVNESAAMERAAAAGQETGGPEAGPGQEYERVQVDATSASAASEGTYADSEEAEESESSEEREKMLKPLTFSSPLPAYFGALRTAAAQGDKTLLFFEDEQGVVRMVRLIVGRKKTTWELVSNIQRSAE